MAAFRKGDRVEVTHNGEVFSGTVVRGGKKVTMLIDGTTDSVLKGSAALFRITEIPAAKDEPSIMDKWSIKNYKSIVGHGDSPTFDADVFLNGKKVMTAHNNGWGGCNDYCGNYELEKQLKDDAKEWAISHGIDTPFEPEDMWIHWYANEKPIGITAKAMWEEYKSIV